MSKEPRRPPHLRPLSASELLLAHSLPDRTQPKTPSLEQWKVRRRNWLSPPPYEVRLICRFLVAHPNLIVEERWHWYIYHALLSLIANMKPPKPEEVAKLVDILMDIGVPVADARMQVARSLKKSIEAVKQSHLRHRRAKRDKSR